MLTTDDHPELVVLVNEAKRKGGSSQGGGGFLINEYRHVLVPTQSGKVLHAGAYTKDLEFKYGVSWFRQLPHQAPVLEPSGPVLT